MTRVFVCGVLFQIILSVTWIDDAHAYIAGSVTPGPGRFDVGIRYDFLGGKAGPLNVPEGQQTQEPRISVIEATGSHNFGELSVFEDFSVRLTNAYFVSAGESLNGRLVYAEDKGDIVTLEVSGNLVHEVDRIFGIFVRTQRPIGMDIAKFSNPKIDLFGVGVQGAGKYSDVFGSEYLIYFGSGFRRGEESQNASVTVMVPLAFYVNSGFFKHGAAVKVGPFFDGDTQERTDLGYGTPAVRAFRLGMVILPSVRITQDFGIEAGYVQKFSGAYFRNTVDFFIGARLLL